MSHDPVPLSRWSQSSPRRRLAIILAVVALHMILIVGLFRAFGGIPALLEPTVPRPVPMAYDVPLPTPSPPPVKVADRAEGEAGKKAVAKAIVAAPQRFPISAVIAPRAAATGDSTQSGASVSGIGTGGGGAGNGAGGRVVAQKALKIAGDIKSARDYPAATRDARIGSSVIVALTVGTDGRVADCKIYRASGDREADVITCRLAIERFRFRPAIDQNGQPVESVFGWEQRWFVP